MLVKVESVQCVLKIRILIHINRLKTHSIGVGNKKAQISGLRRGKMRTKMGRSWRENILLESTIFQAYITSFIPPNNNMM